MTCQSEAYYGHINTRDWSLYIAATDNGLCFVGSQNEGIDEMKDWFTKKRPEAILVEDRDKVAPYANQLVEYFNGERQSFDLPVDFIGTNFQESIWTELQNIPFGETKTYTDIAENIGRPSSVRAVGAAIGANPVMIVVPCHRVIGKNGKMTGFRGGIPMKERLLGLESS
ncbi:methylated-DNA--[protein]-cysteine S-methyltransferase [Virgibacillus natechei]|uniref:methylated-DNA--[protein]-cysteine S-methyltransferase n=1 Tax=Virgibacillus sp. CBA3643 TaxID=2942278 RepID=UPI0035A35324